MSLFRSPSSKTERLLLFLTSFQAGNFQLQTSGRWCTNNSEGIERARTGRSAEGYSQGVLNKRYHKGQVHRFSMDLSEVEQGRQESGVCPTSAQGGASTPTPRPLQPPPLLVTSLFRKTNVSYRRAASRSCQSFLAYATTPQQMVAWRVSEESRMRKSAS